MINGILGYSMGKWDINGMGRTLESIWRICGILELWVSIVMVVPP